MKNEARIQELLASVKTSITEIEQLLGDPGDVDTQKLPDELALLTLLEQWGGYNPDEREKPGLHEVKDRALIMQKFSSAGFEFDPQYPWCGAGLRAALVHAGYEDPGEYCHKALNYRHYGDECDRKPGAIWVGHAHAAVVSHKEGYIWGCNQSDRVCEQQEKYYGAPVTFRWPKIKKA